MVKWLNRTDDSLDDVDVWEGELDDSTLEILKTWLDNGGCKGNLQTRGDRDSKESGKSIKTKQDSKQLATVGGFQ